MHSEKEGEFMKKNNAIISREENNPRLIFQVNKEEFSICLSEDNPNQIKTVFNELIKTLKNGKYEFALEDSTEDLYANICKEYIKQLNSELAIVYAQLKKYELLEKEKENDEDENDEEETDEEESSQDFLK